MSLFIIFAVTILTVYMGWIRANTWGADSLSARSLITLMVRRAQAAKQIVTYFKASAGRRYPDHFVNLRDSVSDRVAKWERATPVFNETTGCHPLEIDAVDLIDILVNMIKSRIVLPVEISYDAAGKRYR